MTRTDWTFMLDQPEQPRDELTACFPRTARQAFGPYYRTGPLRGSISFLPCLRFGWCGVLAIVLLLAACVIGGAK